ncbi:MAG: ATP-binding cassette domain-containing protein [Candidatus Omnitrophica bacterium]|nr:ATP-binding cassette domain-containing protein [Candidatus Omnitrophota bacterium]MDD5488122.1 ATP-binding cassette domain-containing protein [Candidatus Omnitrophota bacterium]
MDILVEAIGVSKVFRRSGNTAIPGHDRVIRAVDGIDLVVRRGGTFGIVGESGSGKSTIARMITGVIMPDEGKITVNCSLDMVFQDPYNSLNPRMTVGDIVGEPLFIKGMNKTDRRKMVSEALGRVRLSRPGIEEKFPHEFSGGERQRIAIARAIIHGPELIVLDEPVSSLDVSIQAGILNLFKDIQEQMGTTYIFISHDLRVVEFMADEVAVLNKGKIVEQADRETLYRAPRHPYTKTLLSAIPMI